MAGEGRPSWGGLDPWDLENFAYLRDRLEAAAAAADADFLLMEPTTSFEYAVDPHFSQLSEQENYADIDDFPSFPETRKNRRAWSASNRNLKMRSGYEDETEGGESPVFRFFEENGFFRREAPCRKSFTFSCGDFHRRPHEEEEKEEEAVAFFEKKEEEAEGKEEEERGKIYGARPRNFGFSKFGHLKIDYSCSWNDLNKFIRYN